NDQDHPSAATADPAPAPGGVSGRAPEARAPLGVGSTVKHNELIRKLGEGGMGAVFLARDTKLGRLGAVKILLEQGAGDGRFLIEARATARCKHENIVVIHEVDEHGGTPYMVLEHLEGRTLREWLSQRGSAEALAPSAAIELMLPVLRALGYAHAR